MEQLDIGRIYDLLFEYTPKVLFAIITLIIGWWVIGFIARATKHYMEKREVDESLRPFILSLVKLGLRVMLILSVASMVGVKTTSFIAVLGAMAFAVGMALQGSLGNFASGVMILLFKPYKVGDLVKLHDNTGVVDSIQVFNTILLTPDNKRVILPNSLVTGAAIVNISGQGTIRVDMTFGVGYEDDIDHARKVIRSVVDRNDKILKDPPVDIFIKELADSSVNFAVRPWCKSEHYWDVYFYIHEELKKAFDGNNISIPFPQMDIHNST